jgi:DNA-binding response OmpR family regulator
MNAETIRTILYVEDDRVNLHLVKAIFAARADIQIVAAPDGKSGLALAESRRPQLILLDLHLPDMSGEEFLVQLQALDAIAKTPVVVVTGEAFPEQRRKLLALGVADYVTKPFDIDEFEKVVDACLRRVG